LSGSSEHSEDAASYNDAAKRTALDNFEFLVAEQAITRGLVGFPTEETAREIARSLLLAPLLIAPGPIIDVGSGAGFPGVPLLIATGWPGYLVDSKRRSAAFLELVVRDLGLRATVLSESAEIVGRGELREKATSVVARALAPLPVALELTAPLCKVGGRVLITAPMEGHRDPSAELLSELGLGRPELKRLTGPLDLVQHVHIIDKLQATYSRYPRRPGRARQTRDRPDRKDAGPN
jgi:16S rRNA (guanine527-N7)-methyltransferase